MIATKLFDEDDIIHMSGLPFVFCNGAKKLITNTSCDVDKQLEHLFFKQIYILQYDIEFIDDDYHYEEIIDMLSLIFKDGDRADFINVNIAGMAFLDDSKEDFFTVYALFVLNSGHESMIDYIKPSSSDIYSLKVRRCATSSGEAEEEITFMDLLAKRAAVDGRPKALAFGATATLFS
jgi:hypothetical protein